MPDGWSESDQKAIREQLFRILNSGPFHQAQRRQRFLEYIVNEALAGRGERLKGSNVAQAVFDRAETFDPHIDPIVRNEAARVRDRLREYYEGEGQGDPIRISLPKGTYTPHIEFRTLLSSWTSGPSLPDKSSVAVLPFDNIGTDPKRGSPSRWDDRGHHYRSLPLQRLIRHRSQFHRALQGQADRHPPNRSRPQREIYSPGQHPIDER